MVEQRFISLRERLLHAGIAAAHANRAAAELQSHFQQLVDTALARGAELEAARNDSPSVDWNAQLQRAGKDNSLGELAPSRRDFGFPHHSAQAAANPPEFGWDYANTHRVEPMPGGGLLINLNDRCVLVLAPLPFPVCAIGTKKANGELFEHMRDAAAAPEPGAVP